VDHNLLTYVVKDVCLHPNKDYFQSTSSKLGENLHEFDKEEKKKKLNLFYEERGHTYCLSYLTKIRNNYSSTLVNIMGNIKLFLL